MTRKLTCIICPMGCELTVETEGAEVKSVSGNTCPRGKEYAIEECTRPTRTITTTMKCKDGIPVAVKTNAKIPKDRIFDCMKEINKSTAPLQIDIGDVIIKNILGLGADVVATARRK